MEEILDAPVNAERNLKYAGFWIRTAAIFIDGILLAVVNVGGRIAFSVDQSSIVEYFTYTGVIFFVNILYYCGFESSNKQATLGKMILGIKVGDLNGNRIPFGQALARYLCKILSTMILFIGFMMAGWDPKKQALHDKLANTYVFYV